MKNFVNICAYIEEAIKHTEKVVCIYDIEENKIKLLNDAFEQTWALDREKVCKNPKMALERIHRDDLEFFMREYQEIIAQSGKRKFQFRLEMPDKKTRWLQVNCMTVGPKNNIIFSFFDDITPIREKMDVLEKASSRKSGILEIMSHDLAGPLNSIKGLATLLGPELKNPRQNETERIAKMILELSEKGLRLIHAFIEQELVESDYSEVIRQRIDLVKEMKELIEEYQRNEESISKKFIFQSSEEKIYLNLDLFKFSLAINNLIANAIKFSKDQGEIVVSIENQENAVTIAITDQGIGIPEKYHDALFERFTKARRPGLKGEPTMGLGMSIVKSIVDWHGGRIWFESVENKGTKFYIEMPKG